MGLAQATLLTPDDISEVISSVGLNQFMLELIERLELAFIEFDQSKTEIPIRDGFSYNDPAIGLLEWMPILQTGDEMLMKLVAYHPENPKTNGLPTILSTFSLFDATTGNLKAVLDGTLVTALRTGAASAIASRLLARPDSTTIGMIGCGAQSVTQLHALTQLFPIEEVRYFDVDSSSMATFAERCNSFNCQAELIQSSLAQCVSDVDILCVATSVGVGEGPVFEDIPVRNHLHINAVGSDFPGKIEVPLSLLKRSYVTPDCHEQAVKEGECQQLEGQKIGRVLCELLRDSSDHELKDSLTVFDSTGWALEDLVVTQLMLEHAVDLSIGSHIQVVDIAADPKNPYESFSKSRTGHLRLRMSM